MISLHINEQQANFFKYALSMVAELNSVYLTDVYKEMDKNKYLISLDRVNAANDLIKYLDERVNAANDLKKFFRCLDEKGGIKFVQL